MREWSQSPFIIPTVLLELLVENYAVVERVRMSFTPASMSSRRDRSGKSLVVDALGLLLAAGHPPIWCARARAGLGFRHL